MSRGWRRAARPYRLRFPRGAKAIFKTATILLLGSAESAPAILEPGLFQLEPPAPSLRVTPDDCRRTAAAGDIVVCARRPDEYRAIEPRPPKGMEIGRDPIVGLDLGGARLEPLLEQVGMPDGRISKRFMLTVKMPF